MGVMVVQLSLGIIISRVVQFVRDPILLNLNSRLTVGELLLLITDD
jgi:hypothetical protein